MDDKIELNRQMNVTLEAMARALFKSWFVDFDPVHAKAAGEQPYGMDADTAALFPDAFEDSELGPIPQGWRVEEMGKHYVAKRGLSYKGRGLVDNGMPLHNLNSVYEGGGYKYEGLKFYDGEYKARHVAQAGDVLVTNTEQGHDLLLIGYPAIIPQRHTHGIFSHHLYNVGPRPETHLSPRYIYFLLLTDRYHAWVGGFTNGTTVNMLPVDALEKPLIVVPTTEVMQRFDEVIVSILQKQEANHDEAEYLASMRDSLLPKLISGQVRVIGEYPKPVM